MREARRQSFIAQTLVPFAALHFGAERELLGRVRFSAAVAKTADEASALGYTTVSQLCRWTVLCFVLGFAFPRDPLLPWNGGSRFAAHAAESPESHLRRIEADARRRITLWAGPDGRAELRALERVSANDLGDTSVARARESMAPPQWLAEIYPEKAATISPLQWCKLSAIVDHTAAEADWTPAGRNVAVAAMTLWGAHVLQSPIHARMRSAFTDSPPLTTDRDAWLRAELRRYAADRLALAASRGDV